MGRIKETVKETKMYHKMRDKLTYYGILLQRIEMDMVPDLFYRSWHQDGWIELKVVSRISDNIKIPFRPGQLNWIKGYKSLNGSVFLFLHYDDKLWIFTGKNIRNEYHKSELLRYSDYVSTHWKNTNWKSVYEILDSNYYR